MINKKNPEWKVLITKKSFIRINIPFAQQVADLLKDIEHKKQISPSANNDGVN